MRDDEEARREQDEGLLEAIDEVKAGRSTGPASPRDFTDRAAREALEAEREADEERKREDDRDR
jgi:hypothetical protein